MKRQFSWLCSHKYLSIAPIASSPCLRDLFHIEFNIVIAWQDDTMKEEIMGGYVLSWREVTVDAKS
jgi:hypothetical protein